MNAEREVIPFPIPGLYASMPAELYHAIEAMSSGGCKKILKSPAHYRLMRTQVNQPTEAMQFGTVVHAGILEPHRFDSACTAVPDDAPKRPSSAQLRAKKPSLETIEAIDFWRSFELLAGDRIVLSASDFKRAHRTIEAVRSNRAARTLLEGATIEESFFWQDERYGVPCKARSDARNHGGQIDVKTCQDASPQAFARAIANLLYHCQAAHYCSGEEHVLGKAPEFFVFIAAESEEPHGVKCYAMPSDGLLAGAHLQREACARYAVALSEGEWRGYPETIETIKLPAYALKFDV